jgi:CTP synthase
MLRELGRVAHINREYEAILTGGGLRITGTTPDATYVEIVEVPTHPFFLGCQFHPEFKSKPLEPHPIFRDFIAASCASAKADRSRGRRHKRRR